MAHKIEKIRWMHGIGRQRNESLAKTGTKSDRKRSGPDETYYKESSHEHSK